MMEVVKRYRGERRRYYSGGYMGQKRRELVRRVGYDAKNAAHLIRLLRMGIEFLTEGTMHVERADAPELLEIKRGAWPLEKVKAEAERLFNSRRKRTCVLHCRPSRIEAPLRRNDLGLPSPCLIRLLPGAPAVRLIRQLLAAHLVFQSIR
jgi:hypothetical protein